MPLYFETLWQWPGAQWFVALVIIAAAGVAALGLRAALSARKPDNLTSALGAGTRADASQNMTRLVAAAWEAHTSGRNVHALSLFAQVLALDPHSVEALKGRSLCHSELGDYDHAIRDLHAWVLHAPESGDAYFQRAKVWSRLGLTDMAIFDYRLSLRFSASNAAAREAVDELARVCFAETSDRPAETSEQPEEWRTAALP